MPRRAASGALARSLGNRIRMLREAKSITQETLAWDCGFAKGFLSQVEAGKCVPSLAALAVLAKRLGVDPIELLATDPRKPLHQLVQSVRAGDVDAVREALAALAMTDEETARANRQAAESRPDPSRRRGRSSPTRG